MNSTPDPLFSRRHYQRLRFYWRGRKGQGGASRTDQVDLDLASAGLIERNESYGVVYFRITSAGERELAAETQREVERRRPHHDLAGRVAAWLREQGRVTWENIEFADRHASTGQIVVRPDVFSIAPTYNPSRLYPLVHEVKISRADFLADMANPGKRAGYARLCDALYYACPLGVIDPGDLPADCGLVVESSPGVFEIAKKVRRKKADLTPGTYLNLILKPGQHPSA